MLRIKIRYSDPEYNLSWNLIFSINIAPVLFFSKYPVLSTYLAGDTLKIVNTISAYITICTRTIYSKFLKYFVKFFYVAILLRLTLLSLPKAALKLESEQEAQRRRWRGVFKPRHVKIELKPVFRIRIRSDPYLSGFMDPGP